MTPHLLWFRAKRTHCLQIQIKSVCCSQVPNTKQQGPLHEYLLPLDSPLASGSLPPPTPPLLFGKSKMNDIEALQPPFLPPPPQLPRILPPPPRLARATSDTNTLPLNFGGDVISHRHEQLERAAEVIQRWYIRLLRWKKVTSKLTTPTTISCFTIASSVRTFRGKASSPPPLPSSQSQSLPPFPASPLPPPRPPLRRRPPCIFLSSRLR